MELVQGTCGYYTHSVPVPVPPCNQALEIIIRTFPHKYQAQAHTMSYVIFDFGFQCNFIPQLNEGHRKGSSHFLKLKRTLIINHVP